MTEAVSSGEQVSESRRREEIARRRTFAIISHPDAGKTTLTEKLLLYGGAVHLAGAVKAQKATRHATSDWIAIEQERGISVTSSVLQFPYGGLKLNLLDTPGHQDFGEDTLRTLLAADSAIMLLDNRKGVEDRTRQLFEVCRRRRLPIVTFVNKCDREGADPLTLLDDVTRDLGVKCSPVSWPIRSAQGFVGVYDRHDRQIHLFERDGSHGAQRPPVHVDALDSARVRELIGPEAHARLLEELELLDAVGEPFDQDAFLAGELTPVFFGSALTNFGVEPFLKQFLKLSPPPGPREVTTGTLHPTDEGFAGFVFKVQANMDPRHRDRIAFVRVCSGHFTAGMSVRLQRTGKPIRLASPQQFMAQERVAIEEAWPGDVIGVYDRGSLRVGDSLATEEGLEFGGFPRFAPEHFGRLVVPDPLRRKHLDTGLRQLGEEGAVQVLYTEEGSAFTAVVAAVGQLQFDVLIHRLDTEYGVKARLERLPFSFARWVEGPEDVIRRIASLSGRLLVSDSHGAPLVLFPDRWSLQSALGETRLTWLDATTS
ncbi:MAG TPA: peptide chain release factor 3 [Gemmatimonadales bacterium]|nr:peptide chain release factor 3 [Gemmatimonadales bacterium]